MGLYYSLYVDASSLNLACQNLSYSLTGLPGDWQTSPYFFNLTAGQVYRVRVRDECTGCVYEREYEIPQSNLIRPEDCPCCGDVKFSVVPQGIQWQGTTGSITINVVPDACCDEPLTVPALPYLTNGMRWTTQTEAMFPYTATSATQPFQLTLNFESPAGDVPPFVSTLAFVGCVCGKYYTVPLFFGRYGS